MSKRPSSEQLKLLVESNTSATLDANARAEAVRALAALLLAALAPPGARGREVPDETC